MEDKKRILRLNYENRSYIFDPINYKAIQEKRVDKRNLIYKDKKSIDIKSMNSPLDILIDEFVEDIITKNLNMKDLNLALHIVKILEKIENLLKDE